MSDDNVPQRAALLERLLLEAAARKVQPPPAQVEKTQEGNVITVRTTDVTVMKDGAG
jgi:hypothetical protein